MPEGLPTGSSRVFKGILTEFIRDSYKIRKGLPLGPINGVLKGFLRISEGIPPGLLWGFLIGFLRDPGPMALARPLSPYHYLCLYPSGVLKRFGRDSYKIPWGPAGVRKGSLTDSSWTPKRFLCAS